MKFPNLKHIDSIEVRNNNKTLKDVKKLISLSPVELNLERIPLTVEELIATIHLLRTLTIEKAIFKLKMNS